MEKEIHLIEKRRKGLLSLIFSRTGVIIILFALAVLTALSVMNWFAGLIAHISAGIILFNVIVIVYLVNSEMDSSSIRSSSPILSAISSFIAIAESLISVALSPTAFAAFLAASLSIL